MIRIGRESQCLPYAGFLVIVPLFVCFPLFLLYILFFLFSPPSTRLPALPWQWYQPPVQEQEEPWEEEEMEEQEHGEGDGEPSMKKMNLDEGPPGAEEGKEKLPGSYPGKN